MALYSQATDMQTRRTIWVAQNVIKGRHQLNSHTSECFRRSHIDGFEAYDLAGLHTVYSGNDWESKHQAFLEKWGEV